MTVTLDDVPMPPVVEVVSDPPGWTPDRISDNVADRLGHHRQGR